MTILVINTFLEPTITKNFDVPDLNYSTQVIDFNNSAVVDEVTPSKIP